MKTAIETIDALEKCFAAGQIVEVVEGTHERGYALVRQNKNDDKLIPLVLGPMSAVDWQSVLSWHENKWAKMMEEPEWKEWAKTHPIPEPQPIKGK